MFNIAQNTFRELIRNKILYLILFFGVLLIAFSLVLASLSLGQKEKIVIDFGLAMIEVFGLISVVFIGSQLLFKEIEGKTVYLILTKPIKRYEFILGKYLGFALMLLLITIFQSVIFFGIILYANTVIPDLLVFSIFFIYIKLAILFAIILFFSSFMSSLLSIIITILVYIISHSVADIIDMAFGKNEILLLIGKVLYVIFPNFEALNIKSRIGEVASIHVGDFIGTGSVDPLLKVVHITENTSIGYFYIAFNSVYSLIYLILILSFTILIFNRKTFES